MQRPEEAERHTPSKSSRKWDTVLVNCEKGFAKVSHVIVYHRNQIEAIQKIILDILVRSASSKIETKSVRAPSSATENPNSEMY